MKLLSIDKNKTAIVVIDLQKGIVSRETQPYSAKTVIENTAQLLKVFRQNNMPVFLFPAMFLAKISFLDFLLKRKIKTNKKQKSRIQINPCKNG